jgi:glycosyltransferase involved in cell wall biosynthesis
MDLGGEVTTGEPVDRDGVKVWYFRLEQPRRVYWSPNLTSAVGRSVGSFDFVHLHSLFLWPTTAAARAARKAGVPYALAPRGMLVAELLRRRGSWRKALWMRLLESANIERAALLHVTSELEAAEARRFRLRLPPIAVIPNGVEEEHDEPGAVVPASIDGALARQPLALFLGRLSWKKGLDRLITALPHAPTATLAIAGGDDEGIRPRLEALAAAAGVADRVVFLGPVAGAGRTALLQRAAVVVLPSYSENFGNAALEAMAAGTAVLVTPEVGLADEVRASGAGIVVDGHPMSLGAALHGMVGDDDARAAMGKRGREAVVTRYAWPHVAEAMEAAYQHAMATRPGRPADADARGEIRKASVPIAADDGVVRR